MKNKKKNPAIIVHTLIEDPEIKNILKKFKDSVEKGMKEAGFDSEVKITNVDPRATENESSEN